MRRILKREDINFTQGGEVYKIGGNSLGAAFNRARVKNRKMMRLLTLAALILTISLAITLQYCSGASVRGLQMGEEEEENIGPRHIYRNYGLRSHYDAFDDYGHLRFGRSED
ncbi:unnamed protein product [Leptosia nina]|uniref:Uncharacterized protein n=1 Tax=Leptosia nina TaxID=320188 RepID=A0AAV1JPB0_9NEOP